MNKSNRTVPTATLTNLKSPNQLSVIQPQKACVASYYRKLLENQAEN